MCPRCPGTGPSHRALYGPTVFTSDLEVALRIAPARPAMAARSRMPLKRGPTGARARAGLDPRAARRTSGRGCRRRSPSHREQSAALGVPGRGPRSTRSNAPVTYASIAIGHSPHVSGMCPKHTVRHVWRTGTAMPNATAARRLVSIPTDASYRSSRTFSLTSEASRRVGAISEIAPRDRADRTPLEAQAVGIAPLFSGHAACSMPLHDQRTRTRLLRRRRRPPARRRLRSGRRR